MIPEDSATFLARFAQAFARAALRCDLPRAHHPEARVGAAPRASWAADTWIARLSAAARSAWSGGSGASSSFSRRTLRVATRRRAPRDLAFHGRPGRGAQPGAESRSRPSGDRDGSGARPTGRGGLHAPAGSLSIGGVRIPRLQPLPTSSAAAGTRCWGTANPAGPRPRGGPGGAGSLGLRRRGEGAARADVPAPVDLERHHSRAAVRHRTGEPGPRRGGLASAG